MSKLGPAGNVLVYSTSLIGIDSNVGGLAIAVDSSGHAYLIKKL
jgi:hypothetical protein